MEQFRTGKWRRRNRLMLVRVGLERRRANVASGPPVARRLLVGLVGLEGSRPAMAFPRGFVKVAQRNGRPRAGASLVPRSSVV
jgi:hypothetical protein